jgi:Cu/Ag efflux protein CusF
MLRQYAVILSLTLILTACAGTQTEDMPAAVDKPSMQESNTTTATATVEAVDMANRVVTLKGEDGKTFTIPVSEEVKNLPQVEVGDQVRVEYIEAVAIQVMAADGSAPAAMAGQAMATAEPGAKPAGAMVNEVTVTTTIEAIDKAAQTVTLRGPEGNLETVQVRNPKNLENVEVGDKVVITYSESLAVSVEEI